MSTCPRQSRHVSRSSITTSWPTTTRAISPLSLSRAWRRRSTASASSWLLGRFGSMVAPDGGRASRPLLVLILGAGQERGLGQGRVGRGLILLLRRFGRFLCRVGGLDPLAVAIVVKLGVL